MVRPIPYIGLEGYSVTDIGEVIARDGVSKIKQNINSRGYYKVSLYVTGVGKRTFSVHRLVALAFHPIDDATGFDADHIDADKLNNRAENLQWLTRSQNIKKSFDQGRVNPRKGKLMGTNMMFYIGKENELRLRQVQKDGGSMSGAVNKALTEFFGESHKTETVKTPEKKPAEPSGSGAKVDDLFQEAAKALDDGEQPCCQHPTRPCKHWVWDSQRGDGYKNTLSGRFREAD